MNETTAHYLRVLAAVVLLCGLILAMAAHDKACCSYPRKNSPKLDSISYRDSLLEQQRQKYIERSKNGCK